MHHYVFEKASPTLVRAIWLESDEYGSKSVTDILEMRHDGSKESLKKTIRCLYEMLFIGEQPDTEYQISAAYQDYDSALEGKARKQSSKEINVLTEQLFG